MPNLYAVIKEKLTPTTKTILQYQDSAYTFHNIDSQTAKLAACLKKAGLKPGDRLCAIIEKSDSNVFLYLACVRVGIVYVPLNHAFTKEELDYFIEDSKPSLIMISERRKKEIQALARKYNSALNTLNDLELTNEDHEIYQVKEHSLAAIIYTSGTTGKPKGAMLTHHALQVNAEDLITIWGITERDTILHVLPLFHVHGLFFALHTALLTGASIIMLLKYDSDLFFQNLPNANIFMGVPTHYTLILNDKRLQRRACQHMRLWISGSAPLLPSVIEAFQTKTGYTILERYGMSETGIITSNPLEGERRAGTVGFPLPHVELQIKDDIVQVKGPGLFSGYWNKPEKTKEAFNKGYFITGDRGKINNGYLSLGGRNNDTFKSGGELINPFEIEEIINKHTAVSESAVIGIDHPVWGQAVVAVVAPKIAENIKELIESTLRESLSAYKIPKHIIFLDKLPKNTMGKVQKVVLREMFKDTFRDVLHVNSNGKRLVSKL